VLYSALHLLHRLARGNSFIYLTVDITVHRFVACEIFHQRPTSNVIHRPSSSYLPYRNNTNARGGWRMKDTSFAQLGFLRGSLVDFI